MSEELTEERPNNRLLKLIQSKHADFHPILVLADIASDRSLRESDPAVVTNAAKSMLPYLEPQLKAIEVRGNMKNDFGVLRVAMMDEVEGEGDKIG